MLTIVRRFAIEQASTYNRVRFISRRNAAGSIIDIALWDRSLNVNTIQLKT